MVELWEENKGQHRVQNLIQGVTCGKASIAITMQTVNAYLLNNELMANNAQRINTV